MTKSKLLNLINKAGDAVVGINTDAGFLEKLVTLDFSTSTIKKVARKRPRVPKDNVLVFSWDDMKYLELSPAAVAMVIPLSSILKNEGQD